MRNTLSFSANHTPTEINDSSLFGGVTFQQETNIGSDFQYGAVAAASVKFTVDNSDNLASSWMGHTFQWYCQMSNEDAPVSKGFFTIRDIEKNGRKATITAYDSIYDLNEIADAWIATLTYPITLKQMVSSMAAKTGISIMALTDAYRGNYTVYNNFMTSNITYREILEYIAQVCNVFFYADSATKQIKYKRYTPTNTIIDNTKYVSLNISDYEIEPVDKVQIQSTFDDIGYIAGTGTNAYIITENPLFFTSDKQTFIQEIAANILSELSTITYTPMTFSTLADFGIQCGDIIKVNGKTCYIMKKSIDSSGCEFECIGNKIREVQKDDVNSAITALNNKTNELIRTVDETKSTLTEVSGKVKNIEDEQGNITGQINTLTTDVSEVKQTAQGLTSKVSSVETTVNNLDGEVDTLSQSVSEISQKADSIQMSVNENGTTASITIGGNTFTAVNENGVEEKIGNIDLSGYVTFTGLADGTTTVDGGCIKTGTIDADRINMTGSIGWSDFTPTLQTQLEGQDLPNYIHDTYIDSTRIISPTIEGETINLYGGTFNVKSASGNATYGYIGQGTGAAGSNTITQGVIMSASGGYSGLGDGNYYFIATDSGVRMQGGSNCIYVTNSGVYKKVNGVVSEIGGGGTAVFG